MKHIFTLLFFGINLLASAQLATNISVTSPTCHDSQDGVINVSSVHGCFLPISVTLDTVPFIINNLSNPEYYDLLTGGGAGDDEAFGVWGGMTSAGAVVLSTGYFNTGLAFDTTALVSQGSSDAFVSCHDTTGSLLWAKSFGGSGADGGRAIYCVDNIIYVVGYMEDSLSFAGSTVLSNGGFDGFVAKYDMAGNELGMTTIGGGGYDELRSVWVHENRLYAVGNHRGTINVGPSTLVAVASDDALVVCLDTALNALWGQNGGGANYEYLYDLVGTADTNGVEALYVAGTVRSGSATFGSTTVTTAGGEDIMVGRIDTNGTWIWASVGGGTDFDAARGIDIYPTGDTIVVGGYFGVSMSYGLLTSTSNGSYDGFLLELDTAGNPTSLYNYGGTSFDYILDVENLTNGHNIFVGQMSDTLFYSSDTLVSFGVEDGIVAKVNDTGNVIWAKNFGGTSEDSYTSVHLGADNRLHAAGMFQLTAFTTLNDSVASLGGRDVIITNDDIFGSAPGPEYTGLGGGTYTITTVDAKGNILIDSVMVVAPDSMTITGVITPASTASSNDGAIDITVTGGTPGYTYMWNTTATSEDIDSLMIGTYTVMVTDSNGCTKMAMFVIDTNSGPLQASSVVTQISCFGANDGAINITTSGGSAPYSFLWSSSDSTEDISNLGPGSYTLTITDQDTTLVIGPITIVEPPAISVGSTVTPPSSGSSNDGAIDITVSGGTPSYSYLWNTNDTTQDLNNLDVGTYTLTISDANGCTASISVPVDTIPGLTLITLVDDVTCIGTENGAIDLTVIGGVPPYAFSWSTGATTEDVSGLSAGVYTVTVTDSMSQTESSTDTIISNAVNPSPSPGPINGPQNAQSYQSYVYSVSATNGSSYDWNAIGGVVQTTGGNSASVLWQAGPNGQLIVTETNNAGCEGTDTLDVNILFVGQSELGQSSVKVYPNPATTNLTIEGGAAGSTFQLVDLKGQMVMSGTIQYNLMSISTLELAQGAYTLSIQSETSLEHHRLMITK